MSKERDNLMSKVKWDSPTADTRPKYWAPWNGEWRGFLTESKLFMNYPGCGKLKFWTRFPLAFLKYAASFAGAWIETENL
jgi:hypothetical protein